MTVSNSPSLSTNQARDLRVVIQSGVAINSIDINENDPVPVSLPGITIDSFGRFRVADPNFRFDSQLTYQIDSDLWDFTGVSGVATYDSTNRMAKLTASGNGATNATLQSHYYAPYTPGRSQLAFATFALGSTPGAGAVRQVGYFDGDNGLYLEQTSSGVNLVLKTATNADIETVPQSSWNIDPLNGTGPSAITLDLTKTQILVISLQALYVGRALIAFDIDGNIVPVHEFKHANNELFPYLQYASLPIRYRVETTNAQVSLDAICASVISEGGAPLDEISGRTFTASNGATPISVTTRRPILSIRAKELLNNVKNVGLIIPNDIEILAATNNAFVEIVRNGVLTGASFSSVDSASLAESDTSATAISGGRVVASFCVPASASVRTSSEKGLLGRLVLVYSHLLGSSDTLSVVITSFTGTTSVSASLGWKEIR